jgi:hypothetical protein
MLEDCTALEAERRRRELKDAVFCCCPPPSEKDVPLDDPTSRSFSGVAVIQFISAGKRIVTI